MIFIYFHIFPKQIILCTSLTILIPMFVSVTIKDRNVEKSHWIFNLLTAPIRPIYLHHKLVLARCIRSQILQGNNGLLESMFHENTKNIIAIETELSRHTRLQQGLETIYQLATSLILLFYAQSKTRTSQGFIQQINE